MVEAKNQKTGIGNRGFRTFNVTSGLCRRFENIDLGPVYGISLPLSSEFGDLAETPSPLTRL